MIIRTVPVLGCLIQDDAGGRWQLFQRIQHRLGDSPSYTISNYDLNSIHGTMNADGEINGNVQPYNRKFARVLTHIFHLFGCEWDMYSLWLRYAQAHYCSACGTTANRVVRATRINAVRQHYIDPQTDFDGGTYKLEHLELDRGECIFEPQIVYMQDAWQKATIVDGKITEYQKL